MPRPTRPSSLALFDYIRHSQTIERDANGVPRVSDLPSDLIEQDGKPYMRRHYLLGPNMSGGSTARYHEILESDGADPHDHPWDFVSIILSGSYVETTPDSEREYGPGSVLVRNAEQLHRLTLPSGRPVWTFVVLGRPRRRWGFQTSDGWKPWRQYLGAEEAPASVGRRLAL